MQRPTGLAAARLLAAVLPTSTTTVGHGASVGSIHVFGRTSASEEWQRTAAPAPAVFSTSAAANSAARPLHDSAATTAPAAADAVTNFKGEQELFNRQADMLIGDVWNRLESGLRCAEGDQFDFQVKAEHGCLTVQLPGGSWVTIHKEPSERALRVQNTLFPAWANKTEVMFKMDDGGAKWEEPEDHEDIYSFLEDGLSTQLKTKVNLRGG